MKLLVGVTMLDAVDQKRFRLDEQVTIHRKDLSVYVQPIARQVGPNGYTTTIGDLIRRGIIDSDSAAADILLDKLGGPGAVQRVLNRWKLDGLRLDRNERNLQTEIAGIEWRPEFVDADVLDRAIKAVPVARRSTAYRKYQTDPRDTATPAAMASFLIQLAEGRLLSRESTAFAMQAMLDCATGADRLKAGLAPGWKVAHKTGTSGTYKGLTVATNDVGVLIGPGGDQLAIAVFVADSRASDAERAALIAKLAAVAIRHAQR